MVMDANTGNCEGQEQPSRARAEDRLGHHARSRKVNRNEEALSLSIGSDLQDRLLSGNSREQSHGCDVRLWSF